MITLKQNKNIYYFLKGTVSLMQKYIIISPYRHCLSRVLTSYISIYLVLPSESPKHSRTASGKFGKDFSKYVSSKTN